MISILIFSISIHLILIFFLLKRIIKFPSKFLWLRPLTLTIITWLLYTGFDLFITTNNAVSKLNYYWMGSFMYGMAFCLIVAAILPGKESIQYYFPSAIGILIGLPDFLYLLITKGHIPSQMSWMPMYMQTNIQLYFNVIIVLTLMFFFYFIPFYHRHSIIKGMKEVGSKDEEIKH